MKFSPDSPELTAYALNELPEATRQAIEAQLAGDPELRNELAAVMATAEFFREELIAEPEPALAEVQRAWIDGRLNQFAAAAASPHPHRPHRVRWWLLGTAAMATVITALSIRTWRGGELGSSHETPQILSAPDAAVISPITAAAEATSETVPVGKSDRTITVNENSIRTATSSQKTVANQKNSTPVGSSKSSVRSASTAAAATTPKPTAIPVTPQSPPGLGIDALSDGESYEARRRTRTPTSALSSKSALSTQNSVSTDSYATTPASRPMETARTSPNLASSSSVAAGRTFATESKLRLYREPLASPEPLLAKRYGGGGPAENSTERYAPIVENPFRTVEEAPLSTFGMDVDTASYANTRRFIREGSLPPPDAVRIEEFINYFPYSQPAPKASDPFGVAVEAAQCPWNTAHRLIRVGIRARDLPHGERPPANLIFLVDVSGSMEPENKLPLVKKSLRLLVEQLTPRDKVGLVTYAGEAGVALDPTTGAEKTKILEAIDRLGAGGSTHGSAGIQTAYDLARKFFVKEGINRVLLCTDGDFNVGTTSTEGLLALISEQARSGVFLSVLGFGMGNYQDVTTELLADKGNGNYAYIDSFREARKVLKEQLQATLVTVAKNAKIQIEFNPAKVASWRLLGYENRALADRDFKDDQKDAGDVGAGQTVIVLYEIIPTGTAITGAEALRYQRPVANDLPGRLPSRKKADLVQFRDELLFLKLRHKLPEAATSTEWSVAVHDDDRAWTRASDDFQFSAAVAAFGLKLRNSPNGGSVSYDLIQQLAQEGLGADKEGYRAEFIDLVRQAQKLSH